MAAESLFCTHIWPPWRHVKKIYQVGLGLGFRDEIFRPEWPEPWVSKNAQSLSLGAKYDFWSFQTGLLIILVLGCLWSLYLLYFLGIPCGAVHGGSHCLQTVSYSSFIQEPTISTVCCQHCVYYGINHESYHYYDSKQGMSSLRYTRNLLS